jgi:uncharacterized protein (DUF1697 family)
MKKRYAALLLGINVGNRRMKMADLKKSFEDLGYENVRTLLASGNVLFDTKDSKNAATQKIEKKLTKDFGFEVKIILKSLEELQKIVESEPFKGIPVTKATRLYVTFLCEKNTSTLTLPYHSQLKDFEIMRVDDYEVYSVLTVNPGARTVDSMKILNTEFGKGNTMRNWNTVLKLLSN